MYQKVKEQRKTLVSTLAYIIGMTVPMICELTGLTSAQVTYTRDRNPIAGDVPKTYEDRLMAALRYIGKNKDSEVAKLLENWQPIVTVQAAVAGMIYQRLAEVHAWKQSLRPMYLRMYRALTGDKLGSRADSYKTARMYAEWLWNKHLLDALDNEAIDSIDAFVTRASQLVDTYFGSKDDIVTNPNMAREVEHALEKALAMLHERQQLILRFRFDGTDEPRTLTAASEKFGLSVERWRQIEAKALRTLRHPTRMPIIETVDYLRQQSVTLLHRPQEIPKMEQAQPFFNENLLLRIGELPLSARSANALRYTDIEFVWQLVTKPEVELLKLKNFGRKSLKEVRGLLRDMGLTTHMKLDAETLTQCITK